MKQATPDPMQQLCDFVARTSYSSLPEPVRDYSKTLILDTLGVILGGSGSAAVKTAVDFLFAQGGVRESRVPCFGKRRIPAANAAFATGVMARALDMGAVHEKAIHTAEHTMPVLLAAIGLRDNVSGKELIEAFALGEEVTVRIGIASNLVRSGMNYKTDGGHYIFGSVAAAGKLLGLDASTLSHAEGIASTMTQPHSNIIYSPPTLMQCVHHGFIAQDAITCCRLAALGITGPTRGVLTGPLGYLSLLIHWNTEEEEVLKNLGAVWHMVETSMKPYASCKRTHAAVAGVLSQMRDHDLTFQDIESIMVTLPTDDYEVVAVPIKEKMNPNTETECRFSLPFVVATAVSDGGVPIGAFTAECRSREHVRKMMSRIKSEKDPGLAPWSARVSIRMLSGDRIAGEYLRPKGHPSNPFSREELIRKFEECTEHASRKLKSSTIDRIIDSVLSLEDVQSIDDELLKPLC